MLAAGIASLGAACATEPAAEVDRPLFHRWVWDSTTLIPTQGDDGHPRVLGPGQRVRVGYAAGGVRPLFVEEDLIGYLADSLLRVEPLPKPERVYGFATAIALRELTLSHTARFPPLDSASVERRGGEFVVRALLTAQDGQGRERTVPWIVRMRRGHYRWMIDSVWVGSGRP